MLKSLYRGLEGIGDVTASNLVQNFGFRLLDIHGTPHAELKRTHEFFSPKFPSGVASVLLLPFGCVRASASRHQHASA